MHFYQGIMTRYIGPTDHRGSRVKATAEAGSVTLEWDDALDGADNHAAAAKALAVRFGWAGAYVGGGLPGGRGFVFLYAGEAGRGGEEIAFTVGGKS